MQLFYGDTLQTSVKYLCRPPEAACPSSHVLTATQFSPSSLSQLLLCFQSPSVYSVLFRFYLLCNAFKWHLFTFGLT